MESAALRHNLKVARELAGPEGRVMAVVKADAYGLGVEGVVPELAAAGADVFAVATLDEARAVRALGIMHPIYLLSPALPDERPAVVRSGLEVIPAVSGLDEANDYSRLAVAAGRVQPVHLVLDTGMGRIGFTTDDEPALMADLRAVAALPGLSIDSVASHFPSADEDAAFTRAQWERFGALRRRLEAAGVTAPWHHVANSAGSLTLPRTGPELIRAGLLLYGVSPVPDRQPLLREVVTWKARTLLVRSLPAGHGVSYGRAFITDRPTRVATLAVGYADGYPRALSGQDAWVRLGGERCPVLGRVTMDQIMVEAPESVRAGDVATLLGGDGPSASEFAAQAGTIPWEIFCGLGSRVARVVTAPPP